jgi:Domain of unknown function (DUF4157)
MSAEREHRRDAPGTPEHAAADGRPALRRLATAIGNAAMARLAQPGAGLLPGGTVHPDVEAAIGARRGGGSALDASARARIAPTLGDALTDVRVHHDAAADTLARSVEARAFTVGADVFFARGEYRPNTASGDELLAHELTHVAQQRDASQGGTLRVTDPGGAEEAEAESVARELGTG